jgi:hypothetical protein
LCNKYFHKIDILIHLITTYNHTLNLNIVLGIKRVTNYHCPAFDKIKIILDNIDYKNTHYYYLVEYISNLGCINLVLKVYDYIITHFTLTKLKLYDSYSIIFESYTKMINNKCSTCSTCSNVSKHDRFKDYIAYLRTHILIQGPSYNYYINMYTIDKQ